MSDSIECKELLRKYSIARIPFIAINTIERGRTLDILKEVSEELSLPFYTHTPSRGIYDLTSEKIINDDKSIYGAFDFISEQMKRRKNMTFVLTDVPDISQENDNSRRILDLTTLANESGGVVIVLTNNSVWNQLQRSGMIINLDMPNEEEMYSIIKKLIDEYRNEILIEWDNTDIREAAATLAGVTRIEAENVISILIANMKIEKSDMNEVRYAKDRLFSDISGLERISVSKGDKDVGGLAGLRKWLDEKRVLFTAEKRDELRDKGLQPPRGILLVGVPGCGKSLSAKSISANWQLPLYRLDFATVLGSYVGQSEEQLREAFTTAENVSPCILWIDEIEKGLSGSDSSGVSSHLVGQFLTWLQECKKQIFVVATANDISKLPSELLRRGRFDELFFVDLPTAEERRDIISLYMQRYLGLDFVGDFSDKIVDITDGFTGADLESTVRDLTYRTISNKDFVLTEEAIITAFNNVVPLSQTSPEKIEAIRDWGRVRAVPASGNPIGMEDLSSKKNNSRTREVLV